MTLYIVIFSIMSLIAAIYRTFKRKIMTKHTFFALFFASVVSSSAVYIINNYYSYYVAKYLNIRHADVLTDVGQFIFFFCNMLLMTVLSMLFREVKIKKDVLTISLFSVGLFFPSMIIFFLIKGITVGLC